jgi:hypothetical protein
MMTTRINSRTLLVLGCGGCVILIILLLMNRDYPWVGHDYAYFIPHIIDTVLHVRINGLTIQWYTPSFGGGLPGFPNPQHMQYSIVQLLALWMQPWTAVLVSTAFVSLVGYYFFYKFLNERLELDWRASLLGGMFFLGNGFYIEHLIAGQMGYQLFPLVAIVLCALTDPRGKYIYNGAIVAVVIVLMIFQAGFYLIVILVLSLGIALPLLHLYKPELLNSRHMAITMISAVILATAISISKLYAVAAFMSHFPRQVFDVYNIGLFQAGMGIVAQLLGVMMLQPLLVFSGQNPELLSGALANITGARYGIWETDRGLSPVLIICLFTGLASAIARFRRNPTFTFKRSSPISIILLALSLWVTIEMTLARGMIYLVTKQLPILSSLHVNVRFTTAFILPLIIVGTFQLHRFFLNRSKPSYFAALILLTIVSLFSYFTLPKDIHSREFNAGRSSGTYEKIRSGGTFPVTHIEAINPRVGFVESASSIMPYEPIFGYRLEEFKPHIHLGSVFEEDHGYFNMTNPESLVFPELNGLQPFEKFKVSERDQLQAFLERGQRQWNIPAAQRILSTVSLLALLWSAGILLAAPAISWLLAIRDKPT